MEEHQRHRTGLDSDEALRVITPFLGVYNELVKRHSPDFALEFVKKTLEARLGYHTTKMTLETAVALAGKTNGELLALPCILQHIYALTPAQMREKRIQFLQEITAQEFNPAALAQQAETYYRPTPDEVQAYVDGLSLEDRALLVKSAQEDWETLAAEPYGERFAERITHFARVEKQFGYRLQEYLRRRD